MPGGPSVLQGLQCRQHCPERRGLQGSRHSCTMQPFQHSCGAHSDVKAKSVSCISLVAPHEAPIVAVMRAPTAWAAQHAGTALLASPAHCSLSRMPALFMLEPCIRMACHPSEHRFCSAMEQAGIVCEYRRHATTGLSGVTHQQPAAPQGRACTQRNCASPLGSAPSLPCLWPLPPPPQLSLDCTGCPLVHGAACSPASMTSETSSVSAGPTHAP